MRVVICNKEMDLVTITPSQGKALLKDGGYTKNVFFYGPSGIGKSAIVEEYAHENDLEVVIFSLATEMPEAIGGIPHAELSAKDKEEAIAYFTKLLDSRLAPILESQGKGYVLFFDEMNQASPEVLNALYSICHTYPKKRHWAGHSLEYAQIVGAGNLNDGSDGTVYLNELPTPLHNRFHIFEMVSNRKDTMDYLKKKWKNIPQVAKYINVLLDNDIPPRDIEDILDTIAYERAPQWIASKVGEALTAKIFDIQKKVKTIDPAQTLKLCRQAYKLFNENGSVQWAGELVETEEDLIERLREILSEEEVQAIVKGE